jgi:hypothetical protein
MLRREASLAFQALMGLMLAELALATAATAAAMVAAADVLILESIY